MLSFDYLVNKATDLAMDLLSYNSRLYWIGRFFAPCLPPMLTVSMDADVKMIQYSAECLREFFKEEEEEFKLQVLHGLYLIVLTRYEGFVAQYFYEALIKTLRAHLQLKPDQPLNVLEHNQTLDSVRTFMVWIGENTHIEKVKILNTHFDGAMLVFINGMLNTDTDEADNETTPYDYYL